jgi:nitrite reductase/ring-hydroxylating ferredoxin subunit
VICAASALEDGGRGVRFALAEGGPERGFVVRHGGRIAAYVNECPHVGTELDWEPGEFFDFARIYLVCSTHGALFTPMEGHCIAGPCRGASLKRIAVREQDGQVLLMRNETP